MRIKKTSQTTPVQAEVVNTYSTSTENAYSCDYTNKAFGGTILWTNENPTSNFAAQDINLSSSDYDVYEVFFTSGTGASDPYTSMKSIKGKGVRLQLVSWGGSAAEAIVRWINYTNDTKLSVQNATLNGSNSNGRLIPQYIVGYKTGIFN